MLDWMTIHASPNDAIHAYIARKRNEGRSLFKLGLRIPEGGDEVDLGDDEETIKVFE